MQIFELQLHDYEEGISNGVNGCVDVAFRKINKNSTAFLIWKVENMNLIALTRDQYGIFYENESYVILAAAQYGKPCGVDTVAREVKSGNLEYHIHFWLGSATDPEKSGVAAYKTVELDGFLNKCTTQHRETQGNESARFLSYFKKGIRILKSDSIINNNLIESKLYRVKGKIIPIVTEMPGLSWDYFNSSDVFIIFTRKDIFVWIGRSANAIEKLHATKISLNMKQEYNIPDIVFVDDGYEKTLKEEIKKRFNKYLPLDKRLILPQRGEDQNGNFHKSQMRLYKCSENNGKYRVAEVKSGPFQQCDLTAEDCFIVDQEVKGIWVWVGRKASDKERNEALRNARGFVKKKKYPSNTRVTRVVDGFEPNEFKTLFSHWKDDAKPGKNVKPNILVSKFDAVTMEERPHLATETQLIDDGSGNLTVWRVKQTNLIEIPKERHGYFFSGDCYIVLYTYQTLSGEKHLLYCWLGSNASQEEINTTTIKALEVEEELEDLGFQARIIQGRESSHFLQLFKGKLIIFRGNGTDYDESGKNLKNPTQYLLQIFGSTIYTSKGIQVSIKTQSLNSNYCFVLKRGKKSCVWCGYYSTGDQREMAKLFTGKDCELMLEGKEKDDFFNLLGGKSKYTTDLLKNISDPKPPRLFYCCSTNGKFKAEEIIFFEQKDLLPENVMLLDTDNTIYIWMGKLSTKEEQRLSIQIVIEYLQADPADRDMNITIIHIKQEKEPPTFIGYFSSWDPKLWKEHKTFAKFRRELEMENNENGAVVQRFEFPAHSDFDQFEKYPIDTLRQSNENLPSIVDILNKELHLTHDDFVTLFKMTYIDFEKLPRWKQQEMKKKVQLF